MRFALPFIVAYLMLAPGSGPIAAQEPVAAAVAASPEVAIGEALPGAFFQRPAGSDPVAAVILLGGSEGNDGTARSKAPLFLEHGYAVLGLPYVRGDAIAIYGVSKGAEFALAGASRIDGFAAVVAIVPSDVIREGWGPGTKTGQSSSFSWRGQPLAFVPYVGMDAEIAKYADPKATPRIRGPHDAGRNAHPELVEPARIRVEDIAVPVLVAGGDQDTTWASGEMAQAIAERRALTGLPTVSLVFDFAGHALSGTGEQAVTGTYRYSDADLAAQKVVWPATIAFLDKHLGILEDAAR